MNNSDPRRMIPMPISKRLGSIYIFENCAGGLTIDMDGGHCMIIEHTGVVRHYLKTCQDGPKATAVEEGFQRLDKSFWLDGREYKPTRHEPYEV